jgi:hypothetical protein
MRPGQGAWVSGSSALMRHSMAWPRGAPAAREGRWASPAAMRICSAHQVDAGDHLGDGVLHLDAGVHLHEGELALVVHQELERAGGHVARVAHGPRDGGGHVARRAGVMATEGASSSSFWWRRWIEHSRSPRTRAVPCRRTAPGTRCGAAPRCTSRSREPLPKAAWASLRACRELPLQHPDRRSRTTFMPRPPPPPAALRITGKPTLAASFARGVGRRAAPPAAREHGQAEPLGQGAGADLVAPLPHVLGARADEGEPALRADLANSAFSDRKP